MRWTRWLVAFSLASMSLTAFVPAAQAREVDLYARLSGSATYSKAAGFSEYDRDSHERDVEVTVRDIGSLNGENVVVFVAGTKVGKMAVKSGVAHREWDTEHGQAVPFASAGDRVKVKTHGGTLIASGEYVRSGED